MPFEAYTTELNYPEVDTFADLPAASDYNAAVYLVRTATGVIFVNRKRAGLYLSNGSSWSRMGTFSGLEDHHARHENGGGDEVDATGLTGLHAQGTDQALDTGGANEVSAAQAKTGYDHSQAAHAPSNAQKNSNITKAEIEAKLTGELSSHSHAGGGALSYTELDGSISTTAATQGAGDGAWADWDLTGTAVGTAPVVEIAIYKLGASDICGVRKDGGGLARSFPVLKLATTILLCATLAGVIEIMSTDVSDNDTFSVVGYWS